VEETLWELALGWFARIVLTEVKGERVVSTFPIGLPKERERCALVIGF
jgi:uncharacterized protein (DUF2141 family)